jgi:hypothetical protein
MEAIFSKQLFYSLLKIKIMKASNVFSLLTFIGVAFVSATVVYNSRKRSQKQADLRYAVSHPVAPMQILAATSNEEDKVLASVLNSGPRFGRHLPDWAKRKLIKHIGRTHSN